jgi:hypothetical protein
MDVSEALAIFINSMHRLDDGGSKHFRKFRNLLPDGKAQHLIR